MFASGVMRGKAQLVAMAAAAMLFALPAAFAVPYSGGSSGAYLGVHINDLTPEEAAGLKLADNSGVIVVGIDHDGPACKAGIKTNDVIMSVNGTKIGNMQQMVDMMQTLAAGSIATVGILRDGRPQSVKVTLTSRTSWATPRAYPVPNGSEAKAPMPPMPPVAFPADTDVPLVTPASARRGIVVEALTPQLADYFGVPGGQGVLVRNIQRGSLGASAGLKAGDVIFRIDGQPIRDLADWRGSMHTNSLKTTFSIIRDRREQTVEMVLPGPAGELRMGEDWDSFGRDMDALSQQLPQLGPEIQHQTEQAMMLRSDDLAKMQREIEESVRQIQPQIQKQTAEIQKQMEQMRPEIDKQMKTTQERMKQLGPELQKQMEEMQKSMAVLKQQDFARMREQINQSLKNLTPQIQEQLKALNPQIQQQLRQQMQELQKQMQQHQKDWQDMMKSWPNSSAQPNEM